MIHLIVFVHPDATSVGNRLKQRIHDSFTDIRPKVLASIAELTDQLKTTLPYKDTEIYILLSDTEYRLRELYAIKKWLRSKRVILILPENKRDLFFIGMQLHPRFIFYANETFEDLCSIVAKMTSRLNSVN